MASFHYAKYDNDVFKTSSVATNKFTLSSREIDISPEILPKGHMKVYGQMFNKRQHILLVLCKQGPFKETVEPEFVSNSNHHFVNAKYIFHKTYQLNLTLMY